jgi:hypothetical protein
MERVIRIGIGKPDLAPRTAVINSLRKSAYVYGDERKRKNNFFSTDRPPFIGFSKCNRKIAPQVSAGRESRLKAAKGVSNIIADPLAFLEWAFAQILILFVDAVEGFLGLGQ